MEYAVAVLDIGMTNKKIVIYDEQLNLIDSVVRVFDPVMIADPWTEVNIPAHDLEFMENWFIEEIAKFSKKYPIKVISISTHGATFVCIGDDGKPVLPCFFYTYEPGKDFQDEFYAKCGSPISLQKDTLSPTFSQMINPAKGIFFLQRKFSKQFAKIKIILFYPQYWGFRFTGQTGYELTYTGSHTMLWDHKNKQWSSVADILEIKDLLPKNLKNTYSKMGNLTPEIAKRMGLSTDVIVTMGVHNSNAALLPYLARKNSGDFILNSTGIWCVSLHPQNTLALDIDELGRIVYFNESVLQQPVKTTVFLGGYELDNYVKLWQKINDIQDFPSSTENSIKKILENKDTFLLPEILPGSGQFSDSKAGIWEKGKFYSFNDLKGVKRLPDIIKSKTDFFALIDISIVIQSETALKRAGLQKGTKIFTEGGFRRNKLYNTLLSSILPGNETYLTSIKEATSLGTAMIGVMAISNKSYRELSDTVKIKYIPIIKKDFSEYTSYRDKWIHLADF